MILNAVVIPKVRAAPVVWPRRTSARLFHSILRRIGIKTLLAADRTEVVRPSLILALSGRFTWVDLHIANGIGFHVLLFLYFRTWQGVQLAGVLVDQIKKFVVHRVRLLGSAVHNRLRSTVLQVIAHETPADCTERFLHR